MYYPWQKEIWKRLTSRSDKLPHALLMTGPAGGGKLDFARGLSAKLLCEQASESKEACGTCPSCNWFNSGNHPDFRFVTPGGDETEEGDSETESVASKRKSEQIRINQIRELDDFLNIGTHRQGARVIIIQPAEAMNQATANALLKMLEEPSVNTLFILVSNNCRRLLPTILSRCQIVNFPKPNTNEALAWLGAAGIEHAEDLLSHAGGMPLAANDEAMIWDQLDGFFRDLAQLEQSGPLVIAGRWEAWLKENKEGDSSIDKRVLVSWMQKWVFDLISMKLSGKVVFHAHKQQEVRSAAKGASLPALIDCYNEFLRIKAVSQHPLNPRLFLEDMLARYSRAAISGR